MFAGCYMDHWLLKSKLIVHGLPTEFGVPMSELGFCYEIAVRRSEFVFLVRSEFGALSSFLP